MKKTASSPYEQHLNKNPANYVPLSPLSLLARAATVYPKRVATIHGDWKITWAETYERCRRLGSALAKRGIGAGDTVSIKCAEYSGPVRRALRHCHDRRGFECAQHAARRGRHCLYARARRNQGADRRPRVFRDDREGAAQSEETAAGYRYRRPAI